MEQLSAVEVKHDEQIKSNWNDASLLLTAKLVESLLLHKPPDMQTGNVRCLQTAGVATSKNAEDDWISTYFFENPVSYTMFLLEIQKIVGWVVKGGIFHLVQSSF